MKVFAVLCVLYTALAPGAPASVPLHGVQGLPPGFRVVSEAPEVDAFVDIFGNVRVTTEKGSLEVVRTHGFVPAGGHGGQHVVSPSVVSQPAERSSGGGIFGAIRRFFGF